MARAPTERDSPEIGAGPQQGWPAVLPGTVLAVVVQRRETPVLPMYIPMPSRFVSRLARPTIPMVPEKVGAAAVLTVRLAVSTRHRPSPV